jgi:hypothetical protein
MTRQITEEHEEMSWRPLKLEKKRREMTTSPDSIRHSERVAAGQWESTRLFEA